jgi:hypothetical protein
MTTATISLSIGDYGNDVIATLDGVRVGHSMCFRRMRTFHAAHADPNKYSDGFRAPKATPRKLRAEPRAIIGLLLAAGVEVPAAVDVVWA